MTKAEAVFLAGYTHGDLMAYAIDHDCSVEEAIEQIYEKIK